MKNFFLEGPIQTGKSTLIRRAISQHFNWNRVLGFTCQRLLLGNKNQPMIAGYRLASAEAPIEEYLEQDQLLHIIRDLGLAPLDNTKAYDYTAKSAYDVTSIAGIFKLFPKKCGEFLSVDFPDSSPINRDEVFETMGIQLLQDALDGATQENKNLVLLDEIGGTELLSHAFRTKLYEILRSDIPCIGVIKQEESARQMTRNMPRDIAAQILDYNRELREVISGEIILGMDSPDSHILICHPVRDCQVEIDRVYEIISTWLNRYS
ncbi:MAG: nucleoside-triphosphatase [Bacillota bacterium]|nr:nucleoside-triphosphatase [Bacillota bacterium]